MQTFKLIVLQLIYRSAGLRSTCTTCITCLKRDVSISITVNRKTFYIRGQLQDSNGKSKTIQIMFSARVRHPTRREKEEEMWNEERTHPRALLVYICIIKYMYIRACTDSTYIFIHTHIHTLVSRICNIVMGDSFRSKLVTNYTWMGKRFPVIALIFLDV